jgi:hypothetical protein
MICIFTNSWVRLARLSEPQSLPAPPVYSELSMGCAVKWQIVYESVKLPLRTLVKGQSARRQRFRRPKLRHLRSQLSQTSEAQLADSAASSEPSSHPSSKQSPAHEHPRERQRTAHPPKRACDHSISPRRHLLPRSLATAVRLHHRPTPDRTLLADCRSLSTERCDSIVATTDSL